MRQVMVGKKDRYKKHGIKRTTCVRCDAPATNQIHAEAEPGWWRPLCKNCGYALHKYVLEFLGVPEIDEKMLAFSEKPLG
ncbi:MAG: hypothetical protein V3T23_01885 [Nitrososphaerales archaeon]